MKNKEKREVADMLILILQIGINMLVPIFACTALAVWVSNQTGKPFIAVIIIAIGCIAGFNGVYRLLHKYLKHTDDK